MCSIALSTDILLHVYDRSHILNMSQRAITNSRELVKTHHTYMSQKQYVRALERKLEKLNQEIDQQIMMGRNYKTLAQEHKMILVKLARHTGGPSFFTKISSIFDYA